MQSSSPFTSLTKIDESTFHASELTVTSLTPNGRLNSPWRRPFFSKNWTWNCRSKKMNFKDSFHIFNFFDLSVVWLIKSLTWCLLGRRTVEARSEPEGFQANACSSLKKIFEINKSYYSYSLHLDFATKNRVLIKLLYSLGGRV